MGLYDEGKQKPWHEDPLGWLKRKVSGVGDKLSSIGDDSPEDIARKNAEAAFQATGRTNFGQLGVESAAARQALQDRANGKGMLSPEMLRQGLQQNLAVQRSMAASASPQNAGMAARTAAIQSGRLGYGMSGQATMAGLQEQKQAQDAYGGMLMGSRDQELRAAQGAKQEDQKTWLEKYGPAATAALGIVASDRNLKKNIKGGDDLSKSILSKLKATSYDYKDEKHGKGRQFGPMAQDMEAAGLGHAVIDTPEGKMVHGAKAALSSLALAAALAKRVDKLESGKK